MNTRYRANASKLLKNPTNVFYCHSQIYHEKDSITKISVKTVRSLLNTVRSVKQFTDKNILTIKKVENSHLKNTIAFTAILWFDKLVPLDLSLHSELMFVENGKNETKI